MAGFFSKINNARKKIDSKVGGVVKKSFALDPTGITAKTAGAIDPMVRANNATAAAKAAQAGGTAGPGGGYLGDVSNAYQSGAFNPQSQFTGQATQRMAEAASMNNPLLNPAMNTAQGIMSGSSTNDPNLQAGIDAQMRNLSQGINRDTSTEAAMAGQVGSPAARGLVAERMGAAAAPVISNALSGDFARRQGLAANMAMNAPQLGGAYAQQASNQANLLNAAGQNQQNQALGGFQGMQRMNELLGLQGQMAPGQTQTTVTPGASRASGMLGGATTGMAVGGPWGAFIGGGLGAMG